MTAETTGRRHDRPHDHPAAGIVGGLDGPEGDEWYRIDGLEHMAPFLMTVVSDSDLWMFVSSTGALTAGRVDADHALFPYETDDRLHRAAGTAGPITLIARTVPGGARQLWQPFAPVPTAGCVRSLVKRVLGNELIFEERHPSWDLTFRTTWAPSNRHGWVRTAELVRTGADTSEDGATHDYEVLDGLLDVMPDGVEAVVEQTKSNLVDAYKRAEIGPWGTLAVYSLESLISDRAEPLEALTSTIVWSAGFDGADVGVDPDAVASMIAGQPSPARTLTTGRPGAYLLRGRVSLAAETSASWMVVADIGVDHATLSEVIDLASSPAARSEVVDDVAAGAAGLRSMLERADGLQHSGDRLADAHHLSNVLFNCMRGGVFPCGDSVPVTDLERFVERRHRGVHARHRDWFEQLGEQCEERELRDAASATGDPDLVRLVLEYLPLTFSRRHGDPSRPWNRFSIAVRDDRGEPLLAYEGNWRDIFQNWEALLQSYPTFFDNVVAKFVNATTIEGYNPYRITHAGFDWEIPDPDDPWSHIGYWGDHQIVYLMRLLEMWERYEPGALVHWLDREVFVHADVPYRLASYDSIVSEPRDTITYDEDHAAEIARREEIVGADGRLLVDGTADPDDDLAAAIVHVGLLEKLVVPALAKLTNFVPDGGIWLNTQRPEWNDANNALAGPGLSMVTLFHLRRYVHLLESIVGRSPTVTVSLTESVATWISDLRAVVTTTAPARLDDEARRAFVDRLGRAGEAHRTRVRAGAVDRRRDVPVAQIVELCVASRGWLDASIESAHRPDGLVHSYNRVSFPTAGTARVDHLGPMLEGQVAALSSGTLDTEQALALVEALYDSEMYRPDQDTFLLYPPVELASFADRNLLGDEDVGRLDGVRDEVASAVLTSDPPFPFGSDPKGNGGRSVRFRSTIVNAKALEQVLDTVDATAEERRILLDVHEAVFDHRSFTGRSGRMHGYEGIGSVYWHMVAKLLVAVCELHRDAVDSGAPDSLTRRIAAAYQRIRGGLGPAKTPAQFGAVPTDCYSHTPAHAGAQQPGMTGQVKEEILTRFAEFGLRVDRGRLQLAPGPLAPDEILRAGAGEEPASATLSVCGVPATIEVGSGDVVVVERADGAHERVQGLTVPADASADVFARTGRVASLRWVVGAATIDRWRSISSTA